MKRPIWARFHKKIAMQSWRDKNGNGRLILKSGQMIVTGLGGQLLLLISGPLVARMLGVTDRGYLAGLIIWPVMFSAVGGLGMPAACTYYLTRDREHSGQILGEVCRTAILQSVFASVLASVALCLWIRGKPPEVQLGVFPALLMVPAGLTLQYATAVLQGQHRFTALNVVRILPAALYALAVVILFALEEQRLFVVVLTWTGAYVIAATAGTWAALRRSGIDWRGARDLRPALWRFGLRGYFGAMSPVETLRIDQAAAAVFFPPTALGLYVVALAFSNLPRFIARSVSLIAYPTVSTQVDDAAARRLIWRFFWGTSFLTSICVFLLEIAMPVLIRFFFGHDFEPAIPIARILVVGAGFAAMRRILGEGLRGLGHPHISTVSELSMYPWLAIGAPLLMFFAGIRGLALAVCVGQAISFATAVVGARSAMASTGPRDDARRSFRQEDPPVPDTEPLV